MNHQKILISALIIGGFVFFTQAKKASAHCDTLGGPVTQAAQNALNNKNANIVLPWVKKKDEDEVTKAFGQAENEREAHPEAKDKIDRKFFETVVRIHREGEGASYTGLKPKDANLSPAVMFGDKAVETGNMEELINLINNAAEHSLRHSFAEMQSKKNYDVNDVEAGREYVESYVKFIHQAEHMYKAVSNAAETHSHKPV